MFSLPGGGGGGTESASQHPRTAKSFRFVRARAGALCLACHHGTLCHPQGTGIRYFSAGCRTFYFLEIVYFGMKCSKSKSNGELERETDVKSH